MFGITELPRKDGVVTGDFLAKHASESFFDESFDYKFVDGSTISPVRGRTCDRLHQAYGMALSFVPCSRADGDAALAWMVEWKHPEARVAVLTAELDALFAEKPVEAAPAPEETAPEAGDATEGDTDMATPKAKKGKKGKRA